MVVAALVTVAALAGTLAAVSSGLGGEDTSDNSDASAAEKAAGANKPPARIWDRDPDSVAAVGDSISRGFHACSILKDCPEASWVTGTDDEVKSLNQRLGNSEDRSWNYADTGSHIRDVPAQMRKAGKRQPDLVTMMVGANDACTDKTDAMTSLKSFRDSFDDSLRALRKEAPKAHVFVSSVPDLKRLWQQGRKSNFGIGKEVWRLGICQSMLKDPNAEDRAAVERRDKVHKQVRAYNRILRQQCAKDRRCRYDNDAVYDHRFSGDELSKWDTFHPNKKGQRQLAALAYREIVSARKNG